jgi:hypothetical protein
VPLVFDCQFSFNDREPAHFQDSNVRKATAVEGLDGFLLARFGCGDRFGGSPFISGPPTVSYPIIASFSVSSRW